METRLTLASLIGWSPDKHRAGANAMYIAAYGKVYEGDPLERPLHAHRVYKLIYSLLDA